VAVDETEFSEFFASQYATLCWLGLLLTGDRAEAEVARLLGLPLGTVKSLGHRALARLRERLGEPGLDPARSSTEEGP
jgi:hypothetical protein